MQAILAVTIPFFALVLCGYLAGRSKILPEAAIPGLNLFVLYFALPCMLFRFGASLPVAQVLNPVVLVITLITAVVLVIATIALTRTEAVPMKDAALGALTVVWPNTGFMGVPLLATLLGPAAAGPVITTLLVDLFFTSSLCIALAQTGGAQGGHAPAQIGRLLKGTLARLIKDGPLYDRRDQVSPGNETQLALTEALVLVAEGRAAEAWEAFAHADACRHKDSQNTDQPGAYVGACERDDHRAGHRLQAIHKKHKTDSQEQMPEQTDAENSHHAGIGQAHFQGWSSHDAQAPSCERNEHRRQHENQDRQNRRARDCKISGWHRILAPDERDHQENGPAQDLHPHLKNQAGGRTAGADTGLTPHHDTRRHIPHPAGQVAGQLRLEPHPDALPKREPLARHRQRPPPRHRHHQRLDDQHR